eukprot:11992732-Alexandrium_andersonii.AAC.1
MKQGKGDLTGCTLAEAMRSYGCEPALAAGRPLGRRCPPEDTPSGPGRPPGRIKLTELFTGAALDRAAPPL